MSADGSKMSFHSGRIIGNAQVWLMIELKAEIRWMKSNN